MAEKKQPWMKWYPSDWRSEPALRMVSRAARSLWVDMLGIMHEAEPYGELRLNGRALKVPGLAKLLGDRESDVFRWLSELEVAGVFTRKEDGTIFSRRMVRDHAISLKKQENGLRGGNPLLKQKDKQKEKAYDKAQNLEARSQSPDSIARGDDRWPEVWAAFQSWPKLPDTTTEARAKAAWQRMAAELPPVDELIARIHAQGARLRVGEGAGRGGWATAPHNWLERDRGWAEPANASNVRPIVDEAAARASWNGEAAKLISALGDGGVAKWAAWFGNASFEPGPPARIVVPTLARRKQVEERFGAPLRKAFGDKIQIEVAA